MEQVTAPRAISGFRETTGRRQTKPDVRRKQA